MAEARDGGLDADVGWVSVLAGRAATKNSTDWQDSRYSPLVASRLSPQHGRLGERDVTFVLLTDHAAVV